MVFVPSCRRIRVDFQPCIFQPGIIVDETCKRLSRRQMPVWGPREEVPRGLHGPRALNELLGGSEVRDRRSLNSSGGPNRGLSGQLRT
eukprot:2926684-Pyramimonas_sp.AAC.1